MLDENPEKPNAPEQAPEATQERAERAEELASQLAAEATATVATLTEAGEQGAAAIAETHDATIPAEVRAGLAALAAEAAAAKQEFGAAASATTPETPVEVFPPVIEEFITKHIGHEVPVEFKRKLLIFVENQRAARAQSAANSEYGLALPADEAERRELQELGFTEPPSPDVLVEARARMAEYRSSGAEDLDQLITIFHKTSLTRQYLDNFPEHGSLFTDLATEIGNGDDINRILEIRYHERGGMLGSEVEKIITRLIAQNNLEVLLDTQVRYFLSDEQKIHVVTLMLTKLEQGARLSQLNLERMLDLNPTPDQATRIVDAATATSPDGWRVLLRSRGNIPFELIKTKLKAQSDILQDAYPGGHVVARVIRGVIQTPNTFELGWTDISLFDTRFKRMAPAIEQRPELAGYIPAIDAIQAGVANRSLRDDLLARLFKRFDDEPDPLKKPALAVDPERVPKNMHIALGLYSDIGLSPEDIERLGDSLYTGKALKQGSANERFTSFILEASHHGDADAELKAFFEAVLPIAEQCKTAKSKIVDLTQQARSASALDKKYRPRIASITEDIRRVMEQTPAVPDGLNDQARTEAETAREAAIGAALDRLIEDQRAKLIDGFRIKLQLRDEISPTQTERVIAEFSEPSILFTYATKLERPKRQMDLYRQFLIDIGKKKFPESRYTRYREHLDRVFKDHPELETQWRTTIALEGVHTGEAGKDEERAERVRTIIRSALFNKHVPDETRAMVESFASANPQEQPLVQSRLRTDITALAKGLGKGEAASEELLIQDVYASESGTIPEALGKLRDAEILIQLLKASPLEVATGKIRAKEGGKGGDTPIATLLDRLVKRYPKDTAFGNDIEAIRTVLAARPEEGVAPLAFSVTESDNPDQLMRMGTDVEGSCQNIEGDAELNKNLISYVMDGKIKMLVATNPEGKMIGRTLLRILYDETAGTPVLHLEESYHKSGTPVEAVQRQLLALAKKRSALMGLPLVISGRAAQLEITKPYPNPIVSYGGPGSTEYVDNLGGDVQNGAYKIPAKNLELVST